MVVGCRSVGVDPVVPVSDCSFVSHGLGAVDLALDVRGLVVRFFGLVIISLTGYVRIPRDYRELF